MNERKIVEKIVKMYEDEMADWDRAMPDLIRCKDCLHGLPAKDYKGNDVISCLDETHPYNWYCADGKHKK